MLDYFNMGGHGLYVWPSYALTLISLVFYYFQTLRKKKELIEHLSSMNQFDPEN